MQNKPNRLLLASALSAYVAAVEIHSTASVDVQCGFESLAQTL
jgi:hypothetical protein